MADDIAADPAALDDFDRSLTSAVEGPDVGSHDRAIQAYLNAAANDFGSGGLHNRTGWIELLLDEVRSQARAASEFAALCREWDENGDGVLDGWLTAAERLSLESMIAGWESGFEFGRMRRRAALQIVALRAALDGGDPAAIESALSDFSVYAKNAEFAKDLVRVLGPEGVVELYDDINTAVSSRHLDVEAMWGSGLEDFNDAIALGLSSMEPSEFGEFMSDFLDDNRRPVAAHLALITSSSRATDQVASAAALVAGGIYNPGLNPRTGGLYPVVFHYAFDLDVTTPTAAVIDKASPSAMASLLEHLPADQRDDLVWRWTSVTPNHSDSEWRATKDLFAGTVQEQVDRFLAAVATDQQLPIDPLVAMLGQAGGHVDRDMNASLAEAVAPSITDPRFLTPFLINAANTGVATREVNAVLRAADADPDRLLSDVMDHMALSGDYTPRRIAQVLGYSLAQGDILGDSVQFDGVVKSLVTSTVGLTLKTPLTGPALGAFNALNAEFERLEQAQEAIDTAYDKEAQQNLLAISLHVRLNGAPPGLKEWLDNAERPGDEDALLDWYVDIGNTETPPYDEIEELSTLIDEERDES